MAQKIVIKVQMSSDRCRSKAMALVAATSGVDSVALAGDPKDQLVVVGDGVDPVKLTSALRRKVGPAQIVQVGDVKEEQNKKPAEVAAAAAVVEYAYPWQYYQYPSHAMPVFEHTAGAYDRKKEGLATSPSSSARCSGHTIPLMKPLGNVKMNSVPTILPSLCLLLLLPRISGRDSCLVGESCSIPFV